MNKNRHHFQLEQLEDRLLLAGNVTAIAAGNDLVLIGDSQSNSISIVASGDGVTVSGSDNTRINGATADFIAFANGALPANVLINAGTGDNLFTITGGLATTGSVRFISQGGRDQFGISDARIGGELSIFIGKGSDRVALRDVSIAGDLNVRTRMGFNVISARRVDVGDDVEIFTETDNDFIVFEESNIADDLRAFTSEGIDTVALTNTVIGDHAGIFTGEGSDFVSFDNVGVGNNTRMYLDGGDDVVSITRSSLLQGHVGLFAGRGKDAAQTRGNTFGEGQTRSDFEFTTIDDATISASLTDPGGAFPKAGVAQQILEDDAGGDGVNDLRVTTDTSSNGGTQTSGTLLVDNEQFVITGQTAAGALIDVDRDGDGLFDDGSTRADSSGDYSVTVDLVNDLEGDGANAITVRGSSGGRTGLSDVINVHFAIGTVVRFETSLGNVDVELLDDAAPGHVSNFLGYDYTNSIIQRSDRGTDDSGFIIQSGNFRLNGSTLEEIPADPPIQSEFTGISNVRGTLALALPAGNPNGGTSEYFFNAVDNSESLDAQSFTVFGRVIGNGMEIVDQIHALPTFNLNGVADPAVLADLPLIDYNAFTGQISGTVSVNESAGDILVTGNNTIFQTELTAAIGNGRGQAIRIDGQTFNVRSIISDTELVATLDPAGTFDGPIIGATVEVNELPAATEYVVVDSINILDVP